MLKKTFILICLAAASLAAQGPLAVINGARFEVKYPVAPGAYAQAYGTFTGVPETTANAANLPLPSELGGARVLINNVAAPLYQVGPTVVSFLVPSTTTPGRHPVQLTLGGATVAQGSVDVVPVAPGLFFVLGDPLAQGGIQSATGVYADSSSPVRRGQPVVIYGTGQGMVDATVPEGGVPASGTLARTVARARVFISVDEAEVQFSGLNPVFPGLWQINAVVPNKPYISGQVPVVVTLDGVPTNTVSFWVEP